LKTKEVAAYIQNWLSDYLKSTGLKGYVVGISGGIDSALVSKLCALTGEKTLLLTMPIRQTTSEYTRARNHMQRLKEEFSNVELLDISLTDTFEVFEKAMPFDLEVNHLAMANVCSCTGKWLSGGWNG
jgi:NAD+ synthase